MPGADGEEIVFITEFPFRFTLSYSSDEIVIPQARFFYI